MMDKQQAKNGGITLNVILFLIFLVLKLTEQIDWSWWWVTAPLWLPTVIVLTIALVFLVLVAIISD